MSDIRFNQWLHQSGTGGVSQVDGGHVGIGTTNPDIAVHTANTKKINVGIVTANSVYAGAYYGDGSNLTGLASDKIEEGDTKVEVVDSGDQYIVGEVNGSEKIRIASDGIITQSATHPQIILKDPSNRQVSLRSPSSSNLAALGTDSSHDLLFYTNGYSNEKLRITSGGQIGINQSNPARALTVNALGTGASSRLLRLATQDNNTRFDFSFENTDFLTIQNGVNDSAILKLHKSGHVSKPAHPSFSAKGVGSTFTYFANNNAWYSLGDTVLTNTSYKNDQNFTTSHSFGMNRGVLSNGNSCFNADTTVFTAPVDGFYHFCISLYLRATNGGGTAHIGPWINNSNTNIYMYNGSDTTSGDLAYPPATRTIDVKLSAGDTFFWAVYAVGTDKFSIYQDYSYISGYLIG